MAQVTSFPLEQAAGGRPPLSYWLGVKQGVFREENRDDCAGSEKGPQAGNTRKSTTVLPTSASALIFNEAVH